MVAAFDVAKPCAFDDAWAAAFGVVAAALAVDGGTFVLVTATAAVDVDKFCVAAVFGFVLVAVTAAADVVCAAGSFCFAFSIGGFGAGAGGSDYS